MKHSMEREGVLTEYYLLQSEVALAPQGFKIRQICCAGASYSQAQKPSTVSWVARTPELMAAMICTQRDYIHFTCIGGGRERNSMINLDSVKLDDIPHMNSRRSD